jgi:hypothetical protein
MGTNFLGDDFAMLEAARQCRLDTPFVENELFSLRKVTDCIVSLIAGEHR